MYYAAWAPPLFRFETILKQKGRLDKLYLKRIKNNLKQLPQAYAEDTHGMRLQAVRRRCEGLVDRISVFLNSERYIC